MSKISIQSLLAGIVMVGLGCFIIKDPIVYLPKFERFIDFTGYNVPFGICSVIAGILLLLTSRRKGS
jgi:hypothetical protein